MRVLLQLCWPPPKPRKLTINCPFLFFNEEQKKEENEARLFTSRFLRFAMQILYSISRVYCTIYHVSSLL